MKYLKIYKLYENLEFLDAIPQAIILFKKQFDTWSFDEHDDARPLQTFVEELIHRKMKDDEWNDIDFIDANKECDELMNSAEELSYQYRKGDRDGIAKAEDEYHRLK